LNISSGVPAEIGGIGIDVVVVEGRSFGFDGALVVTVAPVVGGGEVVVGVIVVVVELVATVVVGNGASSSLWVA